MNTIRNLTSATLIAATLAAAFMSQPAEAAGPIKVVQLERVVVIAHRAPAVKMQVVQLPLVVVTAKREVPQARTATAVAHKPVPAMTIAAAGDN